HCAGYRRQSVSWATEFGAAPDDARPFRAPRAAPGAILQPLQERADRRLAFLRDNPGASQDRDQARTDSLARSDHENRTPPVAPRNSAIHQSVQTGKRAPDPDKKSMDHARND